MAPGGMKLALGGSCSMKSTKNNVFRESEHHASLVWRLAANGLSPGGSYCSRKPEILLAPTNLIPTPTILIPFDFRLHTHNSSVKVCNLFHITSNSILITAHNSHIQCTPTNF